MRAVLLAALVAQASGFAPQRSPGRARLGRAAGRGSLDGPDRQSLDRGGGDDDGGDRILSSRPMGRPALLETALPQEQQAAQQLDELKQDALMAWALLPDAALRSRLAIVAAVALAVSFPITRVTYDATQLAAQLFACGIGVAATVLLALGRMWSGWSFVLGRLEATKLDYEEPYGEAFNKRKRADVATRDQLLAEYEARPAVANIARAAAPVAALLVLSAVGLNVVAPGDPYAAYSEEYLSGLAADDEESSREAARSGKSGAPAYCKSRYYKIVAGGSMCD